MGCHHQAGNLKSAWEAWTGDKKENFYQLKLDEFCLLLVQNTHNELNLLPQGATISRRKSHHPFYHTYMPPCITATYIRDSVGPQRCIPTKERKRAAIGSQDSSWSRRAKSKSVPGETWLGVSRLFRFGLFSLVEVVILQRSTLS